MGRGVLLALVLLGGCTMVGRDSVTVDGVSMVATRHKVTSGDRQSPGAIRVDVLDQGFGLQRNPNESRRIVRAIAVSYAQRFCEGKVELLDTYWRQGTTISEHDLECSGRVL